MRLGEGGRTGRQGARGESRELLPAGRRSRGHAAVPARAAAGSGRARPGRGSTARHGTAASDFLQSLTPLSFRCRGDERSGSPPARLCSTGGAETESGAGAVPVCTNVLRERKLAAAGRRRHRSCSSHLPGHLAKSRRKKNNTEREKEPPLPLSSPPLFPPPRPPPHLAPAQRRGTRRGAVRAGRARRCFPGCCDGPAGPTRVRGSCAACP